MSANSWTICSKCHANRIVDLARAESVLAGRYGKIPAEQFMAEQRTVLDQRKVTGDEDTLREDYSIGIDGNSFSVDYRAHCTVCQFSYEFKHNEVLV